MFFQYLKSYSQFIFSFSKRLVKASFLKTMIKNSCKENTNTEIFEKGSLVYCKY